MSKFFCDSYSELWHTRADELGINVIEMPYTVDGEEYIYDLGRSTNFEEFYTRLKSGADAKTQALNVQNYLDFFEPVLAAGEDVIYLHFSRQMSGTFSQMDQAIAILKEKYPLRKVTAVDTGMISIGEGLLVYDAALMWKNGATDEEIATYVEENRNKYALFFAVKDLSQLKRGGRLSMASFVAGTLLNIKPIIHVDSSGRLNKHSMAKGYKAGIRAMLNQIKQNGSNLENHPIIVTHADAPDMAEELVQCLRSEISPNLEIWMQPIGPAVAAHCGVGTVGVAFHALSR